MAVTLVTPSQGLVPGFFPMISLSQVAEVPGAIGASPVYAPQYSSGPAVDQGDAAMQTNTFRQNTGLTGSGVTVGVISDSVNQVTGSIGGVTGTGLALSQSVGALPAG